MDLLFDDPNLLGEGSVAQAPNLLRDLFTTPDATPVTSPRTAEPGPGQLVLLQTHGTLAIADNELQITHTDNSAFGQQGLRTSTAVSREAGRMGLFRVTLPAVGTNGVLLGFWPTTTLNGSPAAAVLLKDDGVYTPNGTLVLAGYAVAEATVYLAVVLDTAGSFVFAKGPGFFSTWALAYWHDTGNAASLYFGLSNYDADLAVQELCVPSRLATLTPTVHVAPTLGQTYSGEIDASWELRFTTAAGPTGSISFKYHVVDANNYHELVINNSTIAWRVVEGGVAGSSTSIASGLGASTAYRLRVTSNNGTEIISLATNAAPDTWTVQEFIQEFRFRTTGDAVVTASGYSVTRLIAYPMFWPSLPLARSAPQASMQPLALCPL